MGIDGIGKPPGAGAPPGTAGVGGAGPAAPAREGFKVEKTGTAQGVSAADPFARLQRGEIGVEEYLDQRVNHAVEHLASKLSADQLEFVKGSLRDQLRTDPVLLELVRRATGSVPAGS